VSQHGRIVLSAILIVLNLVGCNRQVVSPVAPPTPTIPTATPTPSPTATCTVVPTSIFTPTLIHTPTPTSTAELTPTLTPLPTYVNADGFNCAVASAINLLTENSSGVSCQDVGEFLMRWAEGAEMRYQDPQWLVSGLNAFFHLGFIVAIERGDD